MVYISTYYKINKGEKIMNRALTEHQNELISLLAGYEEMTDDDNEYYLRYLNGHVKQSDFLTPWTIPDSEGYYIIKQTKQGISVLTTRLNANTVQSLIQRKMLIKHTHPFSYKSTITAKD